MATSVVSVSDFRGEFPEFGEPPIGPVADDKINRALARATRLHNATKAGTMYAAAHLLCTDVEKVALAPDGGAGVVSKESIGTKSVEYQTNAGADERRSYWSRSAYGREFLKIEERNVRQGFGILVA